MKLCAREGCEVELTSPDPRKRYCCSTCKSAALRARKRAELREDTGGPLPARACRCENDTPTERDEDGRLQCLACGHARFDFMAAWRGGIAA